MKKQRMMLVLCIACAMGVIAAGSDWLRHRRASQGLSLKLDAIESVRFGTEIPCSTLAAAHPVVLLALGQSNAGNHGALRAPTMDAVPVVVGDQCALVHDPLPGATGQGGSIWSALPRALADAGLTDRSVVLSVLAVDATSIDDWTGDNSPLRARLVERVFALARQDLMPSLVLWQQGEADARQGMPSAAYAAQLRKLQETLRLAGTEAPILLAKSTICRSSKSESLRGAVAGVVSSGTGFGTGPDTDALTGAEHRTDGCHLSPLGQTRAAEMWAISILAALGT